MSDLQDQLYNMLLDSPLGIHGAETILLPGLKELLKEVRREEFLDKKKRKRKLSEQQMIAAWAQYRRDLRDLRDRLRKKNQDSDDLLSFLVVFVTEHYVEIARVSTLHVPEFSAELDYASAHDWTTPEDALAMRPDWQEWAVNWLRDALQDIDLDAEPQPGGTGENSGSSGDEEEDFSPAPRPTRKPEQNNDGPSF